MTPLTCPRCRTQNISASRYCNNCGNPLISQPVFAQPRKRLHPALLIPIGFAVFAFIGVCFVVLISLSISKQGSLKPDTIQNGNTTAIPTPISTPALTDAQKLQRAKVLITDAATNDQLDESLQLLKAIPKTAKESREREKLVNNAARIILEREVLGVKPISSPYDGGVSAVKSYLSEVINDYDSSEFVKWSAVSKVYVKKEPYWTVQLRLRAKNAFGAYIVKDVVFYMRQGRVVKSDGL